MHIPFTLLFNPLYLYHLDLYLAHFWWVLYPANVSLWVQRSLGLGPCAGVCCPSGMGDRWIRVYITARLSGISTEILHWWPRKGFLGVAAWAVFMGKRRSFPQAPFHFSFSCAWIISSDSFLGGCSRLWDQQSGASRSESMRLSLNFGLKRVHVRNLGYNSSEG